MTGQSGKPVTLPTTTINCVYGKTSLSVSLPVNDVLTRFLADSGAQISTLPEGHAAVPVNAVLEPLELQPVNADGTPLKTLGTIKLPVEINGISVVTKFYISPEVSPILGTDVMCQFCSVSLDFEKGSVYFGKPRPKNVVEAVVNQPPRVCKLVLSEDLVIPARHEVAVAGMLAARNPVELKEFAGQTCVLESSFLESRSKVQPKGARVLGIVQKGEFPVRLVNPFPMDISLKGKSEVGTLTVLGDNPVVSALGEADDITDVLSSHGDAGSAEVLDKLVEESEIEADQQEQLRIFLDKYQDVFSMKGELGRFDGLPFRIETGDARPVRQMPRRVPFHLKPELDRQIDAMLDQGVIKPSTSAWASPVCMVRKPDGSMRFCVDYRKLNSVSKFDAFPLPNMDDCLASLGGSEVLSSLDLASGYWQCYMEEESAEKAAITTHRGLFQPTVLPFGVQGGVAHFSRVMSSLFSALQWKVLLIYLDDLLVFSKTFEDHLSRLGMVFDILRKSNLKLKPSKCKLLRKKLKFLGHEISAAGISPNLDKVRAVLNYPVPVDVEKLRGFLGLSGYYRDFIALYAEIAKPLTELTEKHRPFIWSVQCEKAFDSIKIALVNAPVLAHPDFSKQFILATDASGVGLGAVLSQRHDGRERVISYASRPLSKAERNYSTTERECLGIVWATDHFSHFLLGAEKFLIQTDHNPLTYLRSIPSPRGRLARWISLLEQYSYQLSYVPGKQIPHADALSRLPVAHIRLPTDMPWDELVKLQAEDWAIKRMLQLRGVEKRMWKGERDEVRQLLKVSKDLSQEKGVWCVTHHGGLQVLAPRSIVPRVLGLAHDEAGHFGVDRTLETVRESFYWGSMFRDVTNWCRSCEKCQGRNRPSTQPKAPLQSMPIPSGPWQDIALDFLGPLTESDRGNQHILVITDRLSKYAINVALPDQMASTTADALFWQVFCTHSFPVSIHSDQGKNFESQLFQSMCDMSGMEKTRTSTYHPQCNGTTERYNQTMVTMLSKYVEQQTQSDWDVYLPLVAFSYNSTVHSVTGCKPFELHFGRAPRVRLQMFASTPVDVPVKTRRGREVRDWLKELQSKVKLVTEQAQTRVDQAQEKQKQQYGEDRCYTPFKKGDLVRCREYGCRRGLKPKLIQERWSGPWRVQQTRGAVNYRIVRGKRRLLVHHNRLKPHITRSKVLQDSVVEPSEQRGVEPVEAEIEPFQVWVEERLDDEEPTGPVENQVIAAEGPDVPPLVEAEGEAQPLMGADGRLWCNVDENNIVEGKRR